MKVLLDTHAFLWCLEESDRLGPRARDLLSDPANDVLVSIASFWEIAIKIRRGLLHADVGELAAGLTANGFSLLGVTIDHIRTLVSVPVLHRDPFDHMLIAQSVSEGAVLMTADRQITAYAVATVGCRP